MSVSKRRLSAPHVHVIDMKHTLHYTCFKRDPAKRQRSAAQGPVAVLVGGVSGGSVSALRPLLTKLHTVQITTTEKNNVEKNKTSFFRQ